MTSHATGDGNIPTRDANKKGLKRLMEKNLSILDV